jgi:hypothetical protein
MSECERLSDGLADLAAGRREWTEAEQAHLAACADCTAEWELLGAARGLGGQIAGRLDPEAIGARVLERLAAANRARHARRWWEVIGGLAAAAMITLAVAGGHLPWQRSSAGDGGAASSGVETGAAEIPLPELDSLDASQLEDVLDAMDQPLTGGSPMTAPRLDDLNAKQLERLLHSQEG